MLEHQRFLEKLGNISEQERIPVGNHVLSFFLSTLKNSRSIHFVFCKYLNVGGGEQHTSLRTGLQQKQILTVCSDWLKFSWKSALQPGQQQSITAGSSDPRTVAL